MKKYVLMIDEKIGLNGTPISNKRIVEILNSKEEFNLNASASKLKAELKDLKVKIDNLILIEEVRKAVKEKEKTIKKHIEVFIKCCKSYTKDCIKAGMEIEEVREKYNDVFEEIKNKKEETLKFFTLDMTDGEEIKSITPEEEFKGVPTKEAVERLKKAFKAFIPFIEKNDIIILKNFR